MVTEVLGCMAEKKVVSELTVLMVEEAEGGREKPTALRSAADRLSARRGEGKQTSYGRKKKKTDGSEEQRVHSGRGVTEARARAPDAQVSRSF